MKTQLGEIVTLITLAGEFVGKLEAYDEQTVTLSRPRAIVPTQEGFGFAPTISMTSEHEIEEADFNMNVVLTFVKCEERIEAAWRRATTGLVVAK